MMLALAAVREKSKEVARIQLEDLVAEFPETRCFLVNSPTSISPRRGSSPEGVNREACLWDRITPLSE